MKDESLAKFCIYWGMKGGGGRGGGGGEGGLVNFYNLLIVKSQTLKNWKSF